jgi:histidyl-tRNA synthetase
MITKVKGTQDFLDCTLFEFLIEQTQQHLKTHHFTSIATPILESTELFKRTLGLHTDVVNKEMFTINTGPEGESICLRPEVTAPIMRAFIEHSIQQTPWQVFTWGPMFRYERPQKGRFRQFHQVSIEIVGAPSIAHDVQLLAMLDQLFRQRFKLTNFALQINFLGCSSDRQIFNEKMRAFLATVEHQICATCKERKEKNILRVFDCKNESCKVLYRTAPHTTDSLCAACMQEWKTLQDGLQMLSISSVHVPTLVRGLDYYSKTVFEFVSDALGAQNAFCAGGRYDSLFEQLGGKGSMPALGAALGIERILLMLEPIKDQLPLPQLPKLHVIIPMSAEQQMLALLLADELYAAQLCTQVLLDGASMKSMMRTANKLAAHYCLIVGSDEQQTKTVTVKNMVAGTEEKVAQVELVKYLKK